MDSAIQDLRSAIRSLTARPGYVAACGACLGLGIGLTTTVFSIVDATLLRPLPLEAPERVLLVNETRRAGRVEVSPVSYPNYRDWRERAGAIAELAAVRPVDLALADGGEPVRLAGAYASANLFRVLGAAPALGRGFRAEEDRPGAEPVVVLSDALWRLRYGRDAAVVGRVVSVEGLPHTIVGVMPPRVGIGLPRGVRLWVPLAPADDDSPRDRRALAVYARLAPGARAAQLDARLVAIAAQLAVEHPDANRDRGAVVRPLSALLSERNRARLAAMAGAVALVLLIACADVANLMLARGVDRRRERAMRRALGATRARLLRPLLLEGALIGVASVPVGLAVAWLGLDAIQAAIPETLRPDVPWALDPRALAAAVGAALATSLLASLVPALDAGHEPLRETLADAGGGSAGPRRRRTRDLLVLAEVALSVVLLYGAGLLLRDLLASLHADVGFDTEPLLTLGFDMPGEALASTEARSRRVDAVVGRLAALPGVTAVAASDLQPMRGGGRRTTVIREDGSGEAQPRVLVGGVSAGYLETLGVPIVRGRSFDDIEARTHSGVAVVNQTFAARLWPDDEPIGRRFRLGDEPDGSSFAVIGIARDALTWDLSDRPQPSAFLPYPHVAARTPIVVIRVSGDPARVAGPARAALRAVDVGMPVFEPHTMSEIQRLTFWRARLLSGVFGGFGVAALLLAASGAYGVLACWVGQRRREIGVRTALGARRRDVVRLVVWQGMRPVAAGLVLGLLFGGALARALRGGVWELAAAALLMGSVGLASCYGPASRAAAIDPVRALRE